MIEGFPVELRSNDGEFNVSGQYLQTVENVGYVVIDVDMDCSEFALDKLRELEGTIRTRLLF